MRSKGGAAGVDAETIQVVFHAALAFAEDNEETSCGKDVKQIIAELTPVLRGWETISGWPRAGGYRRGGQRPPQRAPWTGDPQQEMGLHKVDGPREIPGPKSEYALLSTNGE
ncbi:MAG TPA: hypothetical protein VM120_04845 [Bryobacteraceae bacterium]|nr:hypothetical protein [Bryobacteraceae bacterium]